MEKSVELILGNTLTEQEQYEKYGEIVQACEELPDKEAEEKIHQLLEKGIKPHNLKWIDENSKSCLESIIDNNELSEANKIDWINSNRLTNTCKNLNITEYFNNRC